MFKKELLFWNVDTQFDFMNKEGKLYVPGSEEILPLLERITSFAKEADIQVVNTADHHFPNAKELSDTPDFISTFPPHCMANTSGAAYVSETAPDKPAIIKWDTLYSDKEILELSISRNLIVFKESLYPGMHIKTKLIGAFKFSIDGIFYEKILSVLYDSEINTILKIQNYK